MKRMAQSGISKDLKSGYSFELIEHDTILLCKLQGFVTKELLERLIDDSKERVASLREQGKPTLLLTDISEVTGVSPEARRSVKIIQGFKVDKSAIYGAGPLLTMIAQYILRLSGINAWNRIFRSKNQALRWLRGHEQSFQKSLRLTVARFLSLGIVVAGLATLVGEYIGIVPLRSMGFSTGSIDLVIAINVILTGIAVMLLTVSRLKKAAWLIVRVIAAWLVLFGVFSLVSGWVDLQVVPGFDIASNWRFITLLSLIALLLWQATYPLVHQVSSAIFRFTMGGAVILTLVFLAVDAFNLPFSSRLGLGVLALVAEAAIVLVVYRKPNRFPVAHKLMQRYWPGVVTFLAVFIVAIAAWGNARGTIERAALQETKDSLVSEFESSADVLRSYRAFFNASELVEVDEFYHYTDESNLREHNPGIASIMFADGAASGDGYALTYMAPPNAMANIGYDFANHPQARHLLEKARDTGAIESATLSGVTLAGDTPTEESLLAIALYAPGSAIPETVEERRAHVRGFIIASFSAQSFLQDFFARHPVEDGVSLTVTNSLTGDVYYQTPGISPNDSPPLVARSSAWIGGETWGINILKNSFGDGNFLSGPNAFLSAGAILGFFAAMTVGLLTHRRYQIQQLVDTITDDLGHERNRALSLAQKDEAIIESVGDGVIVTDMHGKVTRVNDRFVKMIGWSPEELLGKQLTNVVPLLDAQDEKVPASQRIITRALPSESDKVKTQTMAKATLKDKLRYERKDGTAFPVAITATPVVVGEKIVGAIEVVRDITQEVEIDQAKTEFVSLASHQLRTPLTATKWYSELLLDGEAGPLEPQQRKYAQETFDATNRTIKLVNALLNVSRVEAGSLGVYTEPTDVTKLMADIVEEFSETAHTHHLRVSEKYQAKLPKMQVDPNLLQLIIKNLLANAIKYTPDKGSIVLTLRQDDDGGMLVAVTDTGYGIPSVQQDKVFTKMFRADNARRKITEGTGLGLYLVKSIADYTGCKVWFESTENKGSTFYFHIPKKGMERRRGTTEIA